MSSSLLGNLDKSLNTVPAGQSANYFLYADGSVILHLDSWTSCSIQKIPLLQSFYDPMAANILKVFMACVDSWTALKNDQKFNRRTVAVEEFSQQIKRICFVGQFIFAYLDKIEAQPRAQEKICALLSQLLPERAIVFPRSLQDIAPEAFLEQLDLMTLWKIEDKSPLALTADLLKLPAPQTEILDPLKENPNIAELPVFYKTLVQRMENPTGKWSLWLKDWWGGAHLDAQKSLAKMCNQILEDKNPVNNLIYSSAKLYLGQLLVLFRSEKFPDIQMRTCLDELVHTSKQCPWEWATDAERHYLLFTGKEVTPQDKALQWKSNFIDQQLLTFFPTVYTSNEDAHNAHLMNTLLFHYGERLGKQHLQAPSADIHVVKKSTSLPYQWPDVFRYLAQAWNEQSVESFKTYSQMNKWQSVIGEFLHAKVKEKIPTLQDPHVFVLVEYFDEKGNLNSRGSIRFLKEALEAVPKPRSNDLCTKFH